MNAQVFLKVILTEFYNSIHRLEEDNFDHYAFDKALQRSFDSERHLNFADYFFERYAQFYATYMLFKNQASRDIFFRLICYRLLGHNHINVTGRRTSDLDKALNKVNQYKKGTPQFSRADMLGHKIQAFQNYPFHGHHLNFECLDINLMYGCEFEQYFYKQDNITVKPEAGDVVIDAGACMGETAVLFAAEVGETGFVHSFDMAPLHLAMTQHNIDLNGFTDRFKMVGYGLSNTAQGQEVQPSTEQTLVNPGISLNFQSDLPTITLDAYVRQNNLNQVDFIKMDIEGAEFAALQGAAKTIEMHRPKLAISLYHKFEDYLAIPHYLATEYPFYDLYLDHYTINDQETILYAIARS